MARRIITASLTFLISISALAQDTSPPNDCGVTAEEEERVDRDRNRLYRKDESKAKFPWRLKCSPCDYRTFHLCIQARFFDPSARVYFDTGNDDTGEVDLFNNGGLSPTIDFAAVYVPWRFGRSSYYDSWSWGPLVGVGMSAAAEDSEDGTQQASNAPVVLFSAGLMLEYKFASGPSFGFELGWATGFSSDESFGDADDSATYVGLKINIPISSTKDPTAAPEEEAEE